MSGSKSSPQELVGFKHLKPSNFSRRAPSEIFPVQDTSALISVFPSVKLHRAMKTSPQSSEELSQTHNVFKRSSLYCPNFNRAAKDLLPMSFQTDHTIEGLSNNNPNFIRPNPVRLPNFHYYPPSNWNKSSLEFCCEEYSQTPLQILIKSIIIHVHRLITGLSWPCVEIFDEIHNVFHEAVDAVIMMLRRMQMEEAFNIIALTMSDGAVSDRAIMSSLDSKRNTYSNVTGEFKLSTKYVRDALQIPEPSFESQFSALQPVTPYFLEFISTNTAKNPKETLKLQLVEGRDNIFQIATNVEENRAFLPLIFCIGMIFGCPFAGSITPFAWVMRKEVLYMIATAFNILDIDIADMISVALQEDMRNVAEQKPVFCLPIWRALFASNRSFKDGDCVSHIPRTNTTFVDIFRYTEIVDRTVGVVLQRDEEVNAHYDRIINTYYGKGNRQPSSKEISAILMFEKNREIVGHFKPKLLWVKHRIGRLEHSNLHI